MFSDFEPDRGHIPTETTKREVVNDVIIFGVHGLEGQTVFSLSGGVTYHLDNTNYAQVTQQQAVAIMDNALTQRPKDTNLHWTFNHAGQQYTAIAQTLERSRKDGNFIWAGTDTTFPTRGNLSLSFGRYYNSFSVRDEGLGMGWHVTPLGSSFQWGTAGTYR
nr:DUF6531 domain-containing protein [Enterovibrio nigricans]